MSKIAGKIMNGRGKMKKLLIAILLLFAFSCRIDSGTLMLTDTKYPPKPKDYNVQVFLDKKPTRPYKKIAIIEAADKDSRVGAMADLIERLKKECRKAGADAIIISTDSDGFPITENADGSEHLKGYAIVWE